MLQKESTQMIVEKNFLSNVLLLSILALCLGASVGVAQTPIAPNIWSGSPASAAGPSGFSTLPATTTPGVAVVNVSQWDRSSAVLFNAAGGSYNSRNWEVGGSYASAQANNKYIFFTVTNSAATELQITRLLIRSQVSSTGPRQMQMRYTIGTVTDEFGALQLTDHDASPEDFNLVDTVCVGPGQTATFRFYGWGGTTTAGTMRINNGTSITAFFAAPVTATASNTSPVCGGERVDFTGTASGGVPGYSYSWSGPDGFSSTLKDPFILSSLPTSAGEYTLTVTDTLGCSSTAVPATTTVTVGTSPDPITGTTLLCPMTTTILSDATPGGTWSSSDVSIATVGAATGLVSGIAAGTATITYSLGPFCFATRVVTVDTPPDPITGSLSLCQGLSTTLSSATSGGTWTSDDVAVATIGAATGLVSGVSAGTTNITYTISTGCFDAVVVTVYPFPSPITGTTEVCVGGSTALVNASGGGSWSSSDVGVATVDIVSGVVSGVSAGTATISYILGGTGCYSTTTITVNPLPSPIVGVFDVCVGAVTPLASVTGSGTWSSGNLTVATVGAATGIVTGVSAGTVTITYTAPSSCYTTAIVTVHPLPASITGPSGVCLGATVTVSSASPAGTWSSSNTTVASVNVATGLISGNAVGTAIITYRLVSTGCFVTRVQTVHPLPTTITGPSAVCPGLNVTLGSTPAGGTWSSSNLAAATVASASGVVSGVAAGTTNITYTLSTGCITTRLMTVHPSPPANITPIGDTVFCPGDFVVLTANTGVDLSYQWFESGSLLAGATSATYVATTTNSYTVRVTNGLGCPMLSPAMSILVDAVTASVLVPGGSTSACEATPILLVANPTPVPGISYQWQLDGMPIPGETSDTHMASVSGNYRVVVVNATGCSGISPAVPVTIMPSPATGILSSGITTFCAGGSVTLTSAAGTGHVYQWHSAAGPIAGATGVSYTTSVTDDYHVVVTNGFACTSTSITVPVVVNPLPDVAIGLSGSKVFCSGGSVTMSASSGAAYTYQWYDGGTALAGATNSAYTTFVSGNFRVRIVNTITGCTDMTHADTVATLVSTPDVLALTPKKFCWGGSAYLGTTLPHLGFAVNYQWFRDGVAVVGATNSTYSAGISGGYRCTITVPAGCSVSTSDIAVSEMPLPDPAIAFDGTRLRTNSYYTSYQWYKDLLPLPGATTYITMPSGNGVYKVRVTDTNGCQSVSDIYVLNGVGTTTSVLQGSRDVEVRVYPNPTAGIIVIEAGRSVRARLTGIDGRLLLDANGPKQLDLSIYADGLYFLSLYSEENTLLQTTRIIKRSE